MAKLPLDLSKFKKVHSDEQSTTLRHPGGHEIKLAHKLLSSQMKKELAALPKLAEAESGEPTPRQQAASGSASQMPSAMMADGGDPVDKKKTIGQIIGFPDSVPSPSPKPQGYDDGGEVYSQPLPPREDHKPNFVPMTDEEAGNPKLEESKKEPSYEDDTDGKPHKNLNFNNYAQGGYAQEDPTMPASRPMPPSLESDPGAIPTDSPIDYAVMAGAAPLGRAAMSGAEALAAPAGRLLANEVGAVGADVGEGAAARLAAKTGTNPIAQAGFTDKPKAAKEVLDKVGALAEQGHITMDDLRMAMQQANRKGFAKGGGVDPTTQHLLPGDKTPNRLEKSIVTHQRQRMADGGDVADTGGQQPAQDQLAPQVVNNVEAAPQQPAPPQAPQIDPRVARMRELYNIRVGNDMQYEGRAGQPAPLERMFGPNGNPPAEFQPRAWTNAEKDFQDEQAFQASQREAAQKRTLEQNAIRMRAGLPMMQMPGNEMPVGSTEIPKDLSGGPATQPQQAMPNTLQPASGQSAGQTPDMQHAYKTQLGGIYGEAAAQGQLGQQEAAALEQGVTAQQQQMNDFHAHYAKLDNEYQSFVKDYQNQHIDPSHYLSSMGTGQRIKNAIGLLMGGIAGPDNAPVKFLGQMIDRDIMAQKAEMDKRQNLLSANIRQFGNLHDAAQMTHAMQTGIVADQLKRSAALATNPIAKARAMQAAGQLEASVAPMMYALAAQRGISSSGGGPIDQYLQVLRVMQPERAKEIESRYVPGIGLAQIPLDASTRSAMMERKLLGDNISQLEAFTQKHAGTAAGVLSPQVRAEGEALSRQVQDQYRRANSQGVFKESEAKFVNGVIADSPSALFANWTKLPAYRMAAQINQGNLQALYNSVGLRPGNQMGAPGQQPQAYRPKSFKPVGK